MRYTCTVVGDVYIPDNIMADAVKKDKRFEMLHRIFWGERDKEAMRRQVREIETKGFCAFPPPEELKICIRDTEVLMVHLCPISSEVLNEAKRLKIIVSTRGGIENIDVKEAKKRGIAVISNPAHNANAVAEYCVGLMLAETRNICRSDFALKTCGLWRGDYPNTGDIRELIGLQIGLAGYGTIGKLVRKKLRGFDCKVAVYDPFVKTETIKQDGCFPMSYEELLATSDIISLHMRVSPQTMKMIGKKEISMMKPSAYLINTARAALVDTDALLEALKQGRIRGAATDVYDTEPIDRRNSLIHLDNITCTNHRGGDTVESYLDSPAMVLEQAAIYLDGGKPRFLASMEEEK